MAHKIYGFVKISPSLDSYPECDIIEMDFIKRNY